MNAQSPDEVQRVGAIEQADAYLNTHRKSEVWSLIDRLRDELVRAGSHTELEYGVRGPTGRMVNNGDYRMLQTHVRTKAGPWQEIPADQIIPYTPGGAQ